MTTIRFSAVPPLALLFATFCCCQTKPQIQMHPQSNVAQSSLQESEPKSNRVGFFDSLNKDQEMVLTTQDFVRDAANTRSKDTTLQTSPTLEQYQVQFFATTNLKQAEKEKERIEETLGATIYLVFESPYYKLRAGNFDTREKAEEFKQKMVDIGHERAWIVKSK